MAHVKREGFTRLGSSHSINPIYNVVFVHDLDGDPRESWEGTPTEGSAKDVESAQHEARDDKCNASSLPTVFWPEELLAPDIPKASLWTYGYIASFDEMFLSGDGNNIAQQSQNLVERLERDVENEEPIVFLAIGFGGIIIQDAICRFKGCRNRTRLSIFLGAPHMNRKMAHCAHLVTGLAPYYLQDVNEDNAEILDIGKKVLRNICDNFDNAVKENRIEVYNAHAEGLSPYSKVLSNREKTSLEDCLSNLDISINPDTFQILDVIRNKIARFTSRSDPGYIALLSTLENFFNGRKLESSISPPPCRWNVPYERNENFVGREDILERLLSRIPPTVDREDCQYTIVEGLGGMGKTEVVLEAVYRVHDKFPEHAVFWAMATDINTFESACYEIVRSLDILEVDKGNVSAKDSLKNVLGRESAGNWLLVIDGANDVDLFLNDPYLLKFLPYSRSGSILFTTQDYGFATKLGNPKTGVIRLEEIAEKEAGQLLHKNLHESQIGGTQDAMELLHFLSNIPIAIKQASAYMAQTGESAAAYLKRCWTSDMEIIKILTEELDHWGLPKAYGTVVATTWLISFEHISQKCPIGKQFLQFMCYLGEKDVDLSLIPLGDDELKSSGAVIILEALALITQRRKGNSFDLHWFTQLAIQIWLLEKGPEVESMSRVVENVDKRMPFPYESNVDVWIRYLPHAERVVDTQCNHKSNEAKRSLLAKVGVSHELLGDHRRAEVMFGRFLDLSKELDKEDEMTRDVLNDLGLILENKGEYRKAEETLRKAISLTDKLFGKDHSSRLGTMSNLASVLNRQYRYEEAEQLYQRTIDLTERAVGTGAPVMTMKNLNNFAMLLSNRGKSEKAEQIARQALKLSGWLPAENKTSELIAMSNLSVALAGQKKFEEAEKTYREMFEFRKGLLSEEHPLMLSARHNFALLLDSQEKYAEAEMVFRRLIRSKEHVLGKEHPQTVISVVAFAGILCSLQKYREAESIYKELVELSQAERYPEERRGPLRVKLMGMAFLLYGSMLE